MISRSLIAVETTTELNISSHETLGSQAVEEQDIKMKTCIKIASQFQTHYAFIQAY